uniref:Kinesin family member 26B n=1 Tax=Molossus molossus TaxID=27622 RepID=A0A7J8BMW6_MOLMO|nr:kinesin family member 26B [Molossus molossus]
MKSRHSSTHACTEDEDQQFWDEMTNLSRSGVSITFARRASCRPYLPAGDRDWPGGPVRSRAESLQCRQAVSLQRPGLTGLLRGPRAVPGHLGGRILLRKAVLQGMEDATHATCIMVQRPSYLADRKPLKKDAVFLAYDCSADREEDPDGCSFAQGPRISNDRSKSTPQAPRQ